MKKLFYYTNKEQLGMCFIIHKKIEMNINIIQDNNITTFMNSTMSFDNKLSIYIPRLFGRCDKDVIIERFKSSNIGTINRVDLVEKKNNNGITCYMAFLHFDSWEDNEITRNIQSKILVERTGARLVYNEPYYWILLKNNKPLTNNEALLQERVVSLQERVTALEKQTENLAQWGKWFYYFIELHEVLLAPLWCHAVNNGMEEDPLWMQNDETETQPTMEQISQQTNIVADEDDLSSIFTVETNRYDTDDDTYDEPPLLEPTNRYPESNNIDSSLIVDLTREF